MARKYSFRKLYMPFILYMAGALGLSAGFLVLQQLCMNHNSHSFVDSTCLSDSHTRTLVSVYLTASAYFLISVISAAVNAYRVAQLQRGIEEGVYIAMTPTAPYSYQARAMSTRWWPAIAVMLALQYAPGWIQPLANLGLTTTSVYVRNNSTAQIAAGVGSYNLTAESTVVKRALAAHVPLARVEAAAEDTVGLSGALFVLTELRGFAGGQGSTRAVNGSVTTSIVRSNLVISTAIKIVDASNVFRQTGLVATLMADCTDALLVAPLSELQTNTSRSFNITASVNEDVIIGTGKPTSVVVSDVTSAADSPTSVDFNLTYFEGGCVNCIGLPPSQALNGTLSTCRARASFAVQEYAFNIASGTVTQLGIAVANDTAQLDPSLAGLFTAAYAAASFDANLISSNPIVLESLLQLPVSLPGGLFKSSNSNLLHSTLCTALSQTLGTLGILGATQAGDDLTTAVSHIFQKVVNATTDIPLYSLQLVTYVPTWTAAVLVGAVLGCMLVVGIWGMVWTHLCAINIKEATETTLIGNIDDSFIAKKRTAGASNDPDLQMAHAFCDDRGGKLLFCRATHDPSGKGDRIVISNDPMVGWLPCKTVDYI